VIPRRLHQAYAVLVGYFWLPCPVCGRMFGGHECGEVAVPSRDGQTMRATCRKHKLDPSQGIKIRL
jgi:hypothetical protein